MEDAWAGGLDACTVTVTLLAGILLLLYWYSVSAFSQLDKMGIRHPKPTPFIGNVLLFQQGYCPGASDIIRQYGPITGYYMGRQPIVVLSDPEAVEKVLLTDFADFSNRMKQNLAMKLMSDSLLCLRDESWKRVRSSLTPTFSVACMKEMCPLISQACDVLLSHLLQSVRRGEPCEVQSFYAAYTMDLVTSVAFGTRVDSQDHPDHPLVQNCRRFLKLFVPFKPFLLLTMAFPSIMYPIIRHLPNTNRDRIERFFYKTIRETIALRDGQPSNQRRRDFLQLMLDARHSVDQADWKAPRGGGDRTPQDQETPLRLGEDEILGQAAIFLIAGYENTCSLLSFTTYLLATHPQCQDKLLTEVDHFAETHGAADYNTVDNLPYMDMVISETLRMYPPAYRFAREAGRDCTVMGRKIPAGTLIEIPACCIQNDPQHWPEPERFRPERFMAEEKQKRHPFTYLPFGAGPRRCIGKRMAILAAKMTLFQILQKVRFETCPLTQIPLQVTSVSTLRPKDGVYVKIVTR